MKRSQVLIQSFAVSCFLSVMTPTEAGVIRHDQADGSYTSLATGFASVGDLLWGSFRCSGTLIGDQWILTAAHCLDDATPASGYSFTVGGATYTGVQKFVEPTWTGDFTAGNDIGLLRLDSVVTGVTPAILNSSTSEVGLTGTSVGFGRTGTGLTGDTLASGTKRAGNNVIDATAAVAGWSSNILLADFDNPLNPLDSSLGSDIPLNLEYQVAPGDSGGGLFLDFGSGPVLAGVTSFTAANDGLLNSDYGDFSGWTRVSSHTTFIASTTMTAVPEPSGFGLAGAGLLGLIVRSRRRERQTGSPRE